MTEPASDTLGGLVICVDPAFFVSASTPADGPACMSAFFGSWLVHPLLLGAGALLVSIPILIHLLNKRKFRVIEWAAMDFLIEAEQRNRRRIQIEELLLLALRCLAVLLAGLLVARPFLPSGLSGMWLTSSRHERIIVLDDSPSMSAVEEGKSPFSAAKRKIIEFSTALSEKRSGDSLTLVLTSRPSRPLFADMPLNEQTVATLERDLAELEVSHFPSHWEKAFVELRGLLARRSDKINRVLYVMTDVRQTDWQGMSLGGGKGSDASRDQKPATSNTDAVADGLRTLAAQSAGCFVVDIASDNTDNLSLVDVAPEDQSLLAGVTSRFHVTVRNWGSQTLRDVPVKFIAGGSLPLTANVESVPAGGTATIPFSYTFPEQNASEPDRPAEPVEIRAELASHLVGDQLEADNVAHFAARVRSGISTLIVDGDPSTEFGKSESFFLQRALAPPGLVSSGIQVDVVSDAEFESKSLGSYQVVHVCNLYHLSEQRRTSLEKWVADGGGLVFWPGGQVDDRHYNEELHRRGTGLLPQRLIAVTGDESEQTWSSFQIRQPDHPAVKVFEGDAAVLLESAKVFRWWKLDEPAGDGASSQSVVLRLSDADRSPALIEKPVGRGHVVQMAFPADSDWSNWPEDASYIIVLQELTRHLARTAGDHHRLVVGEPLRHPLDLSQYRADVSITNPEGKSSTRQAVPSPKGNEDDGPEESLWQIPFDETDRAGIYQIELSRTDGQAEKALYAVNLSPGEGDLRRMDPGTFETTFSGSNIRLVPGAELASLTTEGTKGELSAWVIFWLLAILIGEQTLAWWIGRSR